MAAFEMTPERAPNFRETYSLADALADQYRADAELRARIDSGDVEDSLQKLGVKPPPGTKFRIVVNSADTFHVVLPPDPNQEMADEMLTMAGGGTASTAGTAGSVGSIATSTAVSSASSAGSAASAGSVS